MGAYYTRDFTVDQEMAGMTEMFTALSGLTNSLLEWNI